ARLGRTRACRYRGTRGLAPDARGHLPRAHRDACRHRAERMNDVALTFRQAGYVLMSMRRNPRVLVFSVAFPVVLLLLFASIFSKGENATTHFAGGPIKTDAYFTAGILAYAITMACFSSLAIALTTQRESGLLKRFRGTPVPAWTF